MSTESPQPPKIADLVREYLPALLELCAQDPDELAQLQTVEYCRDVFKLNWPLLRTPQAVAHDEQHIRYWVEPRTVLGQEYRVCSQWYLPRHLEPLVTYLLENGLVAEADVAALESWLPDAPVPTPAEPETPAGSGARYRSHAIGNAQNAAVRNLLSRLGWEAFTRKDWLAVTREFGHSCAYCGARAALTVDHAVGVNSSSLGEHRLGNLVPACHACNSAKGSQAYWEFLAGEEWADGRGDVALRRIRAHAEQHGYTPLTEALTPERVAQVQQVVAQLRAEVAEATARAVAEVNAVVEQQA